MVMESSYGLVLWAVPRFRRPASYPTEPRLAPAQADGLRDNPSLPAQAIAPELREGGACLPGAH